MTDETARPDNERTDNEAPTEPHAVSRRNFFLGAGGFAASGLVVGAAAGAAGAFGIAGQSSASSETALTDNLEYAYYNQGHQGGIATAPQKYAVFMVYELGPVDKTAIQVLLARWTAAIAQMVKGAPIGNPDPTNPDAVAVDSGEALDLGAQGLTVTIGLGPGMFDSRFGLAAKRPELLTQLPALPSDQFLAEYTGGDLCLQACADDPQVAYHAIRNLTRMARGTATTKWTVTGFGRASAGANQETPRNLLGFKDGTRNISTAAEFDEWVWLKDQEQGWMNGGTYLAVRKIQQNIEIWDTDRISDQEQVFGRSKGKGAPLTGTSEFDTPDFHKKSSNGDNVISPTAHIALAAHENNGGIKIHRRGYNYTEGIDPVGQIDAGLLFIAFVNDPDHFTAIQRKLGSVDRLNEYISHIGSGVFAIPAGPKTGSYVAAGLFD